MRKVKIYPEKNLLVVQAKGFLNDDELLHHTNEVIGHLRSLPPGMTIINDISEMKPASPQGAKRIQQTQEEAVKLGVSKIIRIVGNPIAKLQISRTARLAGSTYEVVEVQSMEAAMRLVDTFKVSGTDR